MLDRGQQINANAELVRDATLQRLNDRNAAFNVAAESCLLDVDIDGRVARLRIEQVNHVETEAGLAGLTRAVHDQPSSVMFQELENPDLVMFLASKSSLSSASSSVSSSSDIRSPLNT